jgi:hypothetical protein
MIQLGSPLSLGKETVSQCKNRTNVIDEPQAKNLAFTGTYESEILRLSPQDDIATQSQRGKIE